VTWLASRCFLFLRHQPISIHGGSCRSLIKVIGKALVLVGLVPEAVASSLPQIIGTTLLVNADRILLIFCASSPSHSFLFLRIKDIQFGDIGLV